MSQIYEKMVAADFEINVISGRYPEPSKPTITG
jgi:hypothetical protein